MNRPHQRIGAISNAHVGAAFERVALEYFQKLGISLTPKFSLPIGLKGKKEHCFDLGSSSPPVLVECKSHRWTEGAKVPSAKMTVWNEAMLYFQLAPPSYRKILFVLHDKRPGGGESLVSYYRRTYAHLIPEDVEFLEFDESSGDILKTGEARQVAAPAASSGNVEPVVIAHPLERIGQRKQVNGYQSAAVEAASLIASNSGCGPAKGWSAAVAHQFPASASLRSKGCPRGAFLGLCEEGFVIGVAAGDYTRSKRNKAYAVAAVRLLFREPALAENIPTLWDRVLNGEAKVHNHQMNVVIGLWNAGLITHPKREEA